MVSCLLPSPLFSNIIPSFSPVFPFDSSPLLFSSLCPKFRVPHIFDCSHFYFIFYTAKINREKWIIKEKILYEFVYHFKKKTKFDQYITLNSHDFPSYSPTILPLPSSSLPPPSFHLRKCLEKLKKTRVLMWRRRNNR